jgi:hypothetical protein
MTSPGDYRDQPVRRYVLTGGRSAPTRNTVRPETLVTTVRAPGRPLPVTAAPAERDLLGMCRGTLSLAEAAAYLDLPASVVMIVASDLIDSGHLSVRTPPRPVVSTDILQELLDGLNKLV